MLLGAQTPFVGTNAERLALTDLTMHRGRLFFETDTEQVWMCDGAAWVEAGGDAVLDYDSYSTDSTLTTTSASYVDLTSVNVSVTVSEDALLVLHFTCTAWISTAGTLKFIITDSSNNLVGKEVLESEATNYRMNFHVTVHVPVAAGTHTYKVRWARDAGTASCYRPQLYVEAFSR